MNIFQKFMTNNDCFKANRKITVKGIMVHSLGVAQPNSDVLINQWNRSGVSKCVHAFVETDRIVQTLPWDHRGWHAGGSANNTHIGFEICEPSGHTYGNGATMVNYDVNKNKAYFEKVYNNSVELCAMLCKQYKLNPLTDIIDHSEGRRQGVASNHGDVSHWFPRHGKSMNIFRQDVNARLKGGITTTPSKPTLTKPSQAWVRRLQTTLNQMGHRDQEGKVLVVDGIAGARTLAAFPSLRVGDRNELVRLSQERLTELGFDTKGIDGIFGNNTASAVIKMKKAFMGSTNPTSILGGLSKEVLLGLYVVK